MFVLVLFVAVFGFFTILARFAMTSLFVHLARVGGQFPSPIAEPRRLQMLDGCADVFHSGFVAAFAFAIAVFTFPLAAFAVLVALGHFGFHVAKQFFGFFVFALFAQFIDLAFGSLDELTHFLVLFTFVAFALAIAFAVVLMVALAVVGAVTLTAVTLSGRFAGASSCRSSGVFPGSFSGVFPGSFSGILPGAVRSFGGPLAFFFTILLLSQSGQDEQADQGKNGQFGLHEL